VDLTTASTQTTLTIEETKEGDLTKISGEEEGKTKTLAAEIKGHKR